MSKRVNKNSSSGIKDTQKYFNDFLDMIPEENYKEISTLGIGNKAVFGQIRREFSESHLTFFEDISLSNFCERLPNSTYNNIEEENIDLVSLENSMKGNHFDLMIMNPHYSKGGQVWNICRKYTDRIVCLMPSSKYKVDNGYKWIKKWYKVESSFEDARITYDLLITYYDGTQNDYKTYEDFFMDCVDERYAEFYAFNRQNNRGIILSEKRNASVEDFNWQTDFVTINRSCGRDNKFSTINDIGHKWNLEGRRTYKEDEWVSGLAFIRFKSYNELRNFIIFVYGCFNSTKLINETMWGLNLGTVSGLCYLAIPQIDWETISDHPLWIEGKYDEAVLDTMGLKWNDTMTGVVKK